MLGFDPPQQSEFRNQVSRGAMEPISLPVNPTCVMPSDHPDDIVRFLMASHQAGHACVLVILTDIVEGASRPLGTLMAIRGDGHYVGMVSGGCVEASVVHEARQAMAEKYDRVCRYGKGSPWFDIVLPCRGGIGLHLHVLRDVSALQDFMTQRDTRQSVKLCYDHIGQTLLAEPGHGSTGWVGSLFIASFRPDPLIMVFGAGLESHCLVSLAAAAGLTALEGDIACILKHADDRETALVLLHHDLERELPLLRAALETKAFFICCLGSRRTQERRMTALSRTGYDKEMLARIRGPIGLFGPSREARSVAISILAEIFSLIEARRAGSQS